MHAIYEGELKLTSKIASDVTACPLVVSDATFFMHNRAWGDPFTVNMKHQH